MNLREVFVRFKKNEFFKSVTVLVGGTALAHGITAAATPVLSRMYTPTDFSVLAVFTGLTAIFSVMASLRFDVAVAMPSRDIDAINVLAMAIVMTIVVTVALLVLVWIIPDRIVAWLGQKAMKPFMWLIPVAIFLASSFNALQCWHIRKKQFGLIAKSRVGQSAVAVSTQVGFGSMGFGASSLLAGYTMHVGAACLTLGFRLFRNERHLIRNINWSRMRALAFTYRRFPKYGTLEALSNSAAIQLPIILIAAHAVGPEAGYLMLAMNVMQAPMALVGSAIGQVYLSRAAEEERGKRLGEFTSSVFLGLLKTGIGPILFLGIVAPAIFPLVFGSAWHRAGVLVSWMTPWFIMQFLVSPISMSLHTKGRQKTALVLQLFSFFARVATVWGAAIIARSWISEIYASAGFVVYFVYTVVVLKIVDIGWRRLFVQIFSCLKVISLWVVAGVVVVLSLKIIPVINK